jgi:Xaa-Pro aminopeptidase
MRIERIKEKLKEKNIDLALIFSIKEEPDTHLFYFTGYSGIGVLSILKDKSPFLLVPDMEYEKAKKTVNGIKIFKTEKKKRLLETLSLLLEKEKATIKKIGIDETSCPVYLYKKLKKAFKSRFVDVDPLFFEVRSIKDESELKKIRKACEITDSVIKKIISNFKFKEENELKLFIEEEIRKQNAELAFPPIVASAEGSSQPHYNSSKKIKKGFLMIDLGAKYEGYCADMTRMLYIGKPTKKEISDYSLILNTVLTCEKEIKEKKKFSSLYALALKTLGEKSEFFTHGLGHGLGLDIHECPSVTADEKSSIKENIPFTIEPGTYFPNKYGIRIEDTVVLKNKKLEILTKSRKELVIIRGKI